MAPSVLSFFLVFCLLVMNNNAGGSKSGKPLEYAEKLIEFMRCCTEKKCDFVDCIPVKNTCKCTEIDRILH